MTTNGYNLTQTIDKNQQGNELATLKRSIKKIIDIFEN